MTKKESEKLQIIKGRIDKGTIVGQKAWKFVKELNSFSEERLDRTALIDDRRRYTYRQFFRSWDRYAEVFAALDICEQNGSRVGMIGNISSECIIAFYALNMLGVSVSMIPVEETYDEERWHETIEKEEITDIILSVGYAWPGVLRMISKEKKGGTLRNAIVLRTYVDGPFAAPLERLQSKLYERIVNVCPDVDTMDRLIDRYETTSFTPGAKRNDETAVITHTSGTTKGIHKPILLSDRAMNSAAVSLMKHELISQMADGAVTAMTKEMTAAYGMINMVHVPLAFGITNVIVPMGGFNAHFHRAIKKYRVSMLMTSAQQFEEWMKCSADTSFDFSSLQLVTLGGAYVSPDTLNRINSFIKKNGGHTRAVSGYGLSEAGGACIIPDPRMDTADTIGKPLPGVEVRIYDEDDGKFYTLDEGPRTGGLYISSDSISSGCIGDKVFFEREKIDGRPYICTFDLVSTPGDGTLTYAGRMNRFFANNEGIDFNAGVIETAVSKQEGIEACAVVPKYDKKIYDTIPVLYVQTQGTGIGARKTVRNALLETFGNREQFDPNQLPGECVITDNLPFNATGKVDVNLITKGSVGGKVYTIKSTCRDGRLKAVELEPRQEEKKDSGMGCDQFFC
ncbi:MAG: acyl--CoA ligase [Lachnospiraceae bacterium]|nr:acyl--CoA ligase [Lachnospiraceae bacterium]